VRIVRNIATALVAIALLIPAGCAGGTGTVSSMPSEMTVGLVMNETTVPELLVDTKETVAETTGTGVLPVIPLEDVSDDESGSFTIMAWDDSLKARIDTFFVAEHPDFVYEYRTVPMGEYETSLAAALVTEDAPDVFLLDASFSRDFLLNGRVLSVDRLGISEEELSGQYPSTYQYMQTDEGEIKALGLELAPTGIFYNRTVARQALGTDDPATVGAALSSWNGVLETARQVNAMSQGTVKLTPDLGFLETGYFFSRTTSWIADGKVVMDPYAESYLDLYAGFVNEGLTFAETSGSSAWYTHAADRSALLYFTTLDDFTQRMGFGYLEDGITIDPLANPTTGDWGICAPPGGFLESGTWIAASVSNDKRATTAELMRFFTMREGSAKLLAESGMFVNNRAAMEALAADPLRISPLLGGQNPYAVLTASLAATNVSTASERDMLIEEVFFAIARGYQTGTIPTIGAAREVFLTDCEDLRLAS